MLVSKRVCFMKKALKPKRSGSQRRRVVARRRAAVRARRAPAFFEARSLDELARDLVAADLATRDPLDLLEEAEFDGEGGRLTLSYSDLDQLDMLCQRLSGERF